MKYKLKDIAEIIAGGTPSTKMEQYWNGEIAWITPKDLANHSGRYISRGERNITKEGLENSSTKLMPINSVLFTSRAPIGYVAIAKNQVCTNQGFKSLVCKDSICYYMYIYYWLIYNTDYIKSKANGSTFQEISTNVMKEIEIDLPSIDYQKKVANILKKIDEKIELNNQINDNLYKMMKIKFEDWITNLNKYEVSSLSKMANYTNGLAMQKFRPKDNEESLLVIKIKEMNDGITENTERCSTNIKDEVIINNGDVLFAWSGTLCMSILGKGKAGLNQHIFKVTSDKYPKWFYYFWTLKHLNKFKMIAAGKATTMGHIKRGELDISEVLIPEDKELQEMHKIMQPLFNKYINNLIQNETLTQLRDTLLPKLMNGEIDLDKIEN